MNNLGYDKNLYILAFDHRNTFIKNGFSEKEIISAKQIIYEAFKSAVSNRIPKENGAILIDEQFGDEILKDAISSGYITLLTTEKSGQKKFEFEYGDDFEGHIKKFNPTFVKALVHYQENEDFGKDELKKLNDFCKTSNFKFLIEILTDADEKSELTKTAILEFQELGIEPDVWKIEGMNRPEDYSAVISQARSGGRDNVAIVVLGRGESVENVNIWLKAGAKVDGVVGFAIGRSIFWQPLEDFHKGKITREAAAKQIGQSYMQFYKVFREAK